MPLHTDTFYTHRQVFTRTFSRRRFYKQTQWRSYTQTLFHTDAFTHRRFYKQALLHTDTLTISYTQTLLHTDAFTHRRFYTHTHRHFYTQTLLHTDAFTHRPLYTQALLRTDIHRRFYTQTLVHTDAFTHRLLYSQTLFVWQSICKVKAQWRNLCGQFKQLCLRLPFWTQVCPSLCLDFTCSVSAFHLLKRPWSMAKNQGQVAPNHTRKKSTRLRRNKRHLCWMVMRLSRNKRQLCCGRMLADDWRLVGRYDDWTVFTHRRF